MCVYWIVGNYDMVYGILFDEFEIGYFDGYLYNWYIDIFGIDWCVIGYNGWYDY